MTCSIASAVPIGSSSRSVATGTSWATTGTIGSATRPSASSSRRTLARPRRRASGPRGRGSRSPTRSSPKRVAAASAFVLFLGVHALESYILTPIIQRQALDIQAAGLRDQGRLDLQVTPAVHHADNLPPGVAAFQPGQRLLDPLTVLADGQRHDVAGVGPRLHLRLRPQLVERPLRPPDGGGNGA